VKNAKRQPWKTGLIAGIALLSCGLSAARAQTPALSTRELSARDVESRLLSLSARLGIATTSTAEETLAGSAAQGTAPAAGQTTAAPMSSAAPRTRSMLALNPHVHFASYNASLGRFVVATRHFLAVTGGLEGKSHGEPMPQTAGAPAQKNEKPAAASAAQYDPKALSSSANSVLAKGKRLGGSLRKVLDSRPPVERLAVSPSNREARALHSEIAGFVRRLRDVPVANLAPDQLRAFNQVVEDTTTLTILLESVAPDVAETGTA